MTYAHIPLPLWARATVGGASFLAIGVLVAMVALWNPPPGTISGFPLVILVTFFVVIGALLLRYGFRVKSQTKAE